MSDVFERVAIVGVGLIGGSLGIALKQAAPHVDIRGVGRDSLRLERARHLGAVDSFTTDLTGSLEDRDLVILASPVEHILQALDVLGDHLGPGTVVTDVGSTKLRICRKAWSRLPQSVQFIGGHPIAGREIAGVENSLPTLFHNAPYVLCPPADVRAENLARLRRLVEQLGARPLIMAPDKHDRTLAWLSHLPQLLSTALANVCQQQPIETAGSGLRDMTRLAISPYSVWRAVLDTNQDNIDLALQSIINHLQQLRRKLQVGDLADEFASAATFAQKLRGSS
ncbi:MAG: prephenate dehydrogenase/arogenate dehydrogenase family protein [Acidobacteriia bacterium]|nr:prephenate dehydrogenase/arogenate dehydrogenase family protein [Terriglobia bacterium]